METQSSVLVFFAPARVALRPGGVSMRVSKNPVMDAICFHREPEKWRITVCVCVCACVLVCSAEAIAKVEGSYVKKLGSGGNRILWWRQQMENFHTFTWTKFNRGTHTYTETQGDMQLPTHALKHTHTHYNRPSFMTKYCVNVHIESEPSYSAWLIISALLNSNEIRMKQ